MPPKVSSTTWAFKPYPVRRSGAQGLHTYRPACVSSCRAVTHGLPMFYVYCYIDTHELNVPAYRAQLA